jgi:hypothetical protein
MTRALNGWTVGTCIRFARFTGEDITAYATAHILKWLLSLDLHQDRPVSETGWTTVIPLSNKLEPPPGFAPGSSRYEGEGFLNNLRRQKYPMSDLHTPVRFGRPACSAIRHQWGFKMVGAVGIAPTSPRLQRGANLISAKRPKVARTAGLAPAHSSLTGWRIDSSSLCAWWPATESHRALSLKRRLHLCNACRPKVFQSGFAPASRSYQDRALLHKLQEVNGSSPGNCALPDRLKGDCSAIRACEPLTGIRDRCSPGCLRLERPTSLVVPPHGHKWHPWSDSHRLTPA